MQPFDKHTADVGALEACGGDLVDQAATGLQNGTLTRQAYAPAVDTWSGVCAPEVQAAGDPLDSAVDSSRSALAWAAVVTRYWGTQVEDFNTQVDTIVAGFTGQGPDYGAEGTDGEEPTDDQVADARADARRASEHEWWQAHTTYVEDGSTRAEAMLRDGPTADNVATARDAGALPPSAVDPWETMVNGLLGLVRPPSGLGWEGTALWGAGRSGTAFGYLAAWRDKVSVSRFAPRLPNGTYTSPAGASYWQRFRWGWEGSRNWSARPNLGATRASWAGWASKVKTGGVVLGFATGAWDQWSRDEGRTDLSTTARVTRTATRSVLAGGAGWAGAAGGAQLGAAIGTAIFPGAGTVIGGALGGIIGGVIGSGVGNLVADQVVDWAGDAGDTVAEGVADGVDALEDAGDAVGDFVGGLF